MIARKRPLDELFEQYNVNFFSGKLHGWTVVESDRFGTGYTCWGKKTIFIDPSTTERERVLAHEMAHANKQGGHTRRWLKEIERIHKLGAPVNPAEEENAVIDGQMNIEMESEDGDSFWLLADCCEQCRTADVEKIATARRKLGKKCLLHHSQCNSACVEHRRRNAGRVELL